MTTPADRPVRDADHDESPVPPPFDPLAVQEMRQLLTEAIARMTDTEVAAFLRLLVYWAQEARLQQKDRP
jgi:hypothetical protein